LFFAAGELLLFGLGLGFTEVELLAAGDDVVVAGALVEPGDDC
jgi:hypothetical protein